MEFSVFAVKNILPFRPVTSGQKTFQFKIVQMKGKMQCKLLVRLKLSLLLVSFDFQQVFGQITSK